MHYGEYLMDKKNKAGCLKVHILWFIDDMITGQIAKD